MANSHAGYDEPIVWQNENSSILKIHRVKSPEKSIIRWPKMINHTELFTRHKTTIYAVVLSLVALLLCSAFITYMTLQSDENYPALGIEREIAENPEIRNNEKAIDRYVYDIFSEYMGNSNKREIRKILKRQAPNNHESDVSSLLNAMKLHRIQTGSKTPRETEIIPKNDHFFKEIYRAELGNEMSDTERREKNRVCEGSVENCKSILGSMESLIKTTGDNVESLKKIMRQIKINEAPKHSDPHKFEKFLQCIECNKLRNDNADSEQKGNANYDHSIHQNVKTPMKNSSAIGEMIDDSTSNAEKAMENMSANEETKYPNVIKGIPVSWMDTSTSIPDMKKSLGISKASDTMNDFEKNKAIKQRPNDEPWKDFSKMKNTRINVPTGPSAMSDFHEPEDNLHWAETTKTQTIIRHLDSGTTAPVEFRESNRAWDDDNVLGSVHFDPRVTTGTQNQPAKDFYDDNTMILPTAETMKSGQQIQYTPPYAWMPYPICFMGSPISGPPSVSPFKQPMPGNGYFPQSSFGGYSPTGNQFPHRGYNFAAQPTGQAFGASRYQQLQNVQSGPQFSYGNYPSGFQQNPHLGPTAPGGQGFFPSFGNVPSAPGHATRMPYYCAYMPAPTYQFPTVPGVSEFQRSAENPNGLVGGKDKTYDSKWTTIGSEYPAFTAGCAPNYQRCNDGSHCVPYKSWCNGLVDCPDASDETKCSCRDRINNDRICDGYFDCPHGEDELGCFGCSIDTFSCQDWSKNNQRSSCVSLVHRCDGIRQCPDGKDELDCNILTHTYVENADLFMVGYTIGYLHKNWQGRWYPVCSPTESWAADACVAETGFPLREPPRIQIESIPSGQTPTSYLAQTTTGGIQIVPTCYDKAIYVECPKIPCGTRVLSREELNSPFGRNEDSLLGNTRNVTSLKNKTTNIIDNILGAVDASKYGETTNKTNSEIVGSESRVVGGKPSQPKAWPFLVGIRKNGYFNCGGVIINEDWILTAAHCVDGFSSNFYEIQAGLLRRSSFSPMAQTRRANYIKVHPAYRKDTMKNDLAMIKFDEPLLFNRWVRPACLPQSWQSRNYSRREPLPDSTCVTAGWGATFEHGPDPDHLREVEVPITRECKHPEDRNDAEICAGIPQGGRDACQGDSGGPLMCRFSDLDNRWYVAGIVSHGEGCGRPNEPGAYTKVSRFVDWIESVLHSRENKMIGPKPRKFCPGFSCDGGLGKCLSANKRCDRIVHCLDAEDEMNCESYMFKSRENFDPGNNQQFTNAETSEKINADVKNANRSENNFTNIPTNTIRTESYSEVFTMSNTEKSTLVTSTTKENNGTFLANVTTPKASISTTIQPESSSMEYVELTHFTCARLIQSITIDKRCNRVIDCEDGTDENNCTCKDYLANLSPKAICNGRIDCYDGSDEENCAFCRDDEFTCSRSGTCVARTKICDRNIDCGNMEDELDCYSLTNGEYVLIDFDDRPHASLEGVVTMWENNTWRPICVGDNINMANWSNEFCEYFGFGSADSFEKIKVKNSPLEAKKSTKNYVFPYEYSPHVEVPEETDDTCLGIYVRCTPVLSVHTDHLIVTNPLDNNIDYLWPWQAYIFVNGHYHCPAILLEKSWLLTSLRCGYDLDLKRNSTMAVVGMTPTYLYVNSPYQQVSSIDTIKIVKKLDATLLHMNPSVNFTRYVQPIFVRKRIFPATNDDVCIATGIDEKYHTGTTFLQPVSEPCSYCHRCYKNATLQDCKKNNTSTNWSGTIVCRGSDTWYPAAIFHNKDLFCGFELPQTVTSIDYGNAHFAEIMKQNLEPIVGPICDGFQCPLGKCLSWYKVCDGVDDCRDGSDENGDSCQKKKRQCEISDKVQCKCAKSELRCKSGECIPKEAFCDFKKDCEDGSDETERCTCGDYLELTAPHRLCNNVRDCLDKSDENRENCSCNEDSFKCSGSSNDTDTCISRDFVCDGESDCPNGEDESTCRAVHGSFKDSGGTGQVLRRSYGLWHSECFSSPITSTKNISDICRTMGYNSGTAFNIGDVENIYGRAMVPDRDEFYTIRINPQTWIALRNDRPLTRLVVARESCNRAFVKCT